jgi:rare lipoprotein A
MHTRFYTTLTGIIGASILLGFTGCTRIELPDSRRLQTGIASWYGPKFHGKTTSNQEIFDMHDLTAAHPTLPFNTLVMVTNLDNGKSVVVRINDRGPFIKNRIIDLSYAAAKLLDMTTSGVAPVRLEVLNGDTAFTTEKFFSVQIGSFIVKKNAQNLKQHLEKKYPDVFISLVKTKNAVYYRVRIKSSSKKNAEILAQQLKKEGYSILIINQ